MWEMVYLLLLKFGDKSCEVISTIAMPKYHWKGNAMVKVNSKGVYIMEVNNVMQWEWLKQMNKMNINKGFKCVEDMTVLTTTVGTWTCIFLTSSFWQMEVTKLTWTKRGKGPSPLTSWTMKNWNVLAFHIRNALMIVMAASDWGWKSCAVDACKRG